MADQSQTATTILAYTVTGVDTAINANKAIAGSYSDIADAATQLGLSVDQLSTMTGGGIDQGLTTPLNDASTSARTVIRDLDELATKQREIASLPDPAFGAFEGEDAGGGGGINPSALTTAGRLVGGPAGHALRAAGQVSRLADMLPEDTDALKELGAAGAIAAPAVIATVVALKDYTDQINAQKSALAGALSAEDKYYQALTTLTSGAAIKDIESTAQKVAALTAEKNELQGEITSTFAQLQSQFGDAGARALVAGGQTPITQLQTQLDAVNKSITETTGYGTRLQQGLDNDAFAFNDAAAAATKHGELILKEAGAEQQAQQLTSAERQKKIFAIGQEIEADQELLDAGQLTGAQSSDLIDKIRDLRAEQRGYTDVVTSAADALAALTAAQEARTKQDQTYLDTLASEGKIRDAITDDLSKISDLRTEANAKEADNAAASADKIIEIDANAADKRAEIAANSADAIAKIERDAGRTERNAIGNRDTVALTQAQIKEKDALDDQAKSNSKALTQLDTSLKKQEATERASLDRQQRQLETSLNTQTQIANRKLLQDRTDLINVTNEELSIRANSGGQILAGVASMQSQVEQLYFTHATNLVNGLHAILGGAGQAAYLSSYQPLPPAQSGVATQQPQIYTRAQIDSIVHQNLSNLIGMRQGG